MILHHIVAGMGPAVLLLHSTATDSRQWQAQIEDLGPDFTVVAPDLRGYGRSPLTSEPFSHVDDITRLMDSLSLEDFAIVASSGGGAIALQVASAVPKRVRALVLLCAAAQGVEPTAELRSFGEKENALLESGDVAGATELNVELWVQPQVDEVTRDLFREMQSHAFRVQLAAGDAVQERDVQTDLARITCPVTVVSGACDLSWFHTVADHLAAELPDATRIELTWAGHLPNLERPAETSRLIRDWMRTGRR
ncbi:alpha/beta fold hydrolase [Homoserinimonas sp. OAct 916]|uniref:alpha/beta fold hydrolase n=1 Tax=Homoserinimonas sp. OAct 916 TaxID=2211450 RepID=UPI000DBE8C3C|nr:alpha/beta hydrolase [Homoserinimonas sp. OAct 916]